MSEKALRELSRHTRIVCADVGNMPTTYHDGPLENKTSTNDNNKSCDESSSNITTVGSVTPSADTSKTDTALVVKGTASFAVEVGSRKLPQVTVDSVSCREYDPNLSSGCTSAITSDDRSSTGDLPPASKQGSSKSSELAIGKLTVGHPTSSDDHHGVNSSQHKIRSTFANRKVKGTGVRVASDSSSAGGLEPRFSHANRSLQSWPDDDGFSSSTHDDNTTIPGATRDWSFVRRTKFAGTESTSDWHSAREKKSYDWSSIRESTGRDWSSVRGLAGGDGCPNRDRATRGRPSAQRTMARGRHTSSTRITNRERHLAHRIDADRDDIHSDASSDTRSTVGSDSTGATGTTSVASSTPCSRGRSVRGRSHHHRGRGRGRSLGGLLHNEPNIPIHRDGFVDLDAPGMERAIIEHRNEELCQYMEKLKHLSLSDR